MKPALIACVFLLAASVAGAQGDPTTEANEKGRGLGAAGQALAGKVAKHAAQAGQNPTGSAEQVDSEGWPLFPGYKIDDDSVRDINKKLIKTNIPARFYGNPDATSPQERFIVIYKRDQDPKVAPVPIYRHSATEDIGKLELNLLGGDVLSVASDSGVFYVNLRKGPIEVKLANGALGVDWDVVGSFDPAAERNNINSIKNSKDTVLNGVLLALADAMERGGFTRTDIQNVVGLAGRIIDEKRIAKADCGVDVTLKEPLHYAFDATTKGKRIVSMGINGRVSLSLFPNCVVGDAR